MPTASVALPFQTPRPVNSGLFGSYNNAVNQNTKDYTDIMHGYDSILSGNNNKSSKLNYVPINPVFTKQITAPAYQRSDDLTNAIQGLTDYSQTGGYSDQDVNNIRERGISPIRAIYANAQDNLRRQKVLQGGYSPNYGALTAKLARESSDKIGDITTKVNADIAQMIASGKLSALNSLSSVASQDNAAENAANQRLAELQNQVELANAEEQRRVDEENNKNRLSVEEYNNSLDQGNTENQLRALSGKTSLYGTNPALTQSFANQVLQNNAQNLQAVQTANTIKNQRANIGLNLLSQQLGVRAGV